MDKIENQIDELLYLQDEYEKKAENAKDIDTYTDARDRAEKISNEVFDLVCKAIQ